MSKILSFTLATIVTVTTLVMSSVNVFATTQNATGLITATTNLKHLETLETPEISEILKTAEIKESKIIGQTNLWNGFKYIVDYLNDTVTIVEYIGISSKITVPSEIEGRKVIAIDDLVFSYLPKLQELVISEGVEIIGKFAFAYCENLTTATIPDSVLSIGDSAFYKCSKLTTITLSNNLEAIGEHMFYGCSSLQAIEIPNIVTTIGKGAFYNCSSLTELEIPSGVTQIDTATFYNCQSLQSIILPNGITNIGDSAFYKCENIAEIIIPDSVTSIGNGAFENCLSLTNMTIPEGVIIIGERAFFYCVGLGEIEISSTVESIGYGAFSKCLSLYYIDVDPNNVMFYSLSGVLFNRRHQTLIKFPAAKSDTIFTLLSYINIGNGAFEDCANLINVTLNPGFSIDIGQYAFADCTNLITINLPQDVNSIGTGAFRGCVNLTFVTIQNNEMRFGYDVFTNCYEDLTIKGEAGSTAQQYAQQNNIKFITEFSNELTIYTYETISSSSIAVSGSAPIIPGSVQIFVDEILVDTFLVNESGIYSGIITLNNAQNNSIYIIKAVSDSLSVQTKVVYSDFVPEITSLTVRHNNQRHELVSTSMATPILIFDSGLPLTFEIKFNDISEIDNVCIYSEVDGQLKRLKAAYDVKRNSYIASGFFDEEDKSYMPGKLTVKFSRKLPSYSIDINNVSHSSIYDSIVADNFKNATINTTKNQPEENISEAILIDGEQLTYTTTKQVLIEPDKKTAEQLLEEGYYLISGENDKALYFKLETNDATNELTSYIYIKDIAKTPLDDTISILTIKGETTPLFDLTVFIWHTTVSEMFIFNGRAVNLEEIENKIQTLPNQYNGLLTSLMQYNSLLTNNLQQQQILSSVFALTYPFTAQFIGIANEHCLLLENAAQQLFGLMIPNQISDQTVTQFIEEQYSLINLHTAIRYKMITDPSGYVYEAVHSNRLQDVKTTLYYKDNNGSAVIWDALEYEQQNPIYTNKEGEYAWNVPSGIWQVKCELPEYETAYSNWLPVPPEQKNINIEMISKKNPILQWFNVFENYAEIAFDKYMAIDSINNNSIKLSDKDGEILFTVQAIDAQNGLCKTFKLSYLNNYNPQSEITVTINDLAKSYAQAKAKNITMESSLKPEIKEILADENIELEYGEQLNEQLIEKTISLLTFNNSLRQKSITPIDLSTYEYEVLCTSSDEDIVAINSISPVDKNGNVRLALIPNLPGQATLTLSVKNTTIKKEIPIKIQWGKLKEENYSQKATLTGKIESQNPNSNTTIQLKQNDKVIYSIETKSKSFELSNIEYGIYTLEITKAAHTKFTLNNIAIYSENIDLTQHEKPEISLITLKCGDIDENGNINTNDLSILLSLSNFNKSTEDAVNKLADLDGSGNINAADISILLSKNNFNLQGLTLEY